MKISGSRIDLENGRIDNAVLKNYGETLVGGVSGANSGTAYTVDISSGNIFHIFMNGNCTFTFSNPTPSGTACYFTLLLKQDGAIRTATWPSTVTWAGGSAPTLSTQGGAHDIVSFVTTDGGSSYIGYVGGQSFPAEPAPTLYNLFAWGINSSGELGLGDRAAGGGTSRSVPSQVGTLTTWAAMAAHSSWSQAVRTDGTLWTWGLSNLGQLALGISGTYVARSSPSQVGGMINWSSPPTSAYYSSGFNVKTDGTLWAWGNQASGQLGLGDYNLKRSSPVQVGTLTTWSSVAMRQSGSFALKSDGTLWAWGNGNSGALGLGDSINRSVPTQIGTLATWASIGTGQTNGAAVKTDGTLWVWGYNGYGQLGMGDLVHRSSPTQVGTLTTWSRVADGGVSNHFLVLKTDGTLWAWGKNQFGQLGLGDRGAFGSTSRSSPVQVGTLTTWSRMSTSNTFSTAITTAGTLWTWGHNSYGKLGLNDTLYRSSPVQIGGGAGWVSVKVSASHVLALQDPSLLASNQLWSWGYGKYGALGLRDSIFRSSPAQVGAQTMWSQITRGFTNSLAVKTDGTLWAWGGNSYGQLGLDNLGLQRSSPTQVGPLMNWKDVSTGKHTLALATNGTLWAWGLSNNGALGLGNTTGLSSPVQVGTLATWLNVSAAGKPFSIALKNDGTLWAWGYNGYYGTLGIGDRIDRSSPTQTGTLATWSAISSGGWHTVALRTDGTMWTWGRNNYGVLGMSGGSRSSPAQVGTLATWTRIAGGYDHSLAIKNDGTLWAWGNSPFGQLGLGTILSVGSPVQVGTLTTWASVGAGRNLSFVVKTDGTLWTWGGNAHGVFSNMDGSLGQGDVIHRSSPVQVGTLSTWTGTGIGPFGSHALALLWPGAAAAPSAPLNVVATAGAASGTVLVTFDSPVKSGSKPITQYTVTSSPGNIIATGSNNVILVTGLTDGTLYTFTVTATNAVGTGAASVPSNAAKPGSFSLYAWGSGTVGKLGLGDAINRSSPTQIGTLSTWSSVLVSPNAGFAHATRTDSTLWAWGNNANYYALGLNDAVDRSSPTQVGALAGWSSMTGSYASVIALKTNGTMWSSGKGFAGQLGLGSTTNFSSPVQIGTLAVWSSVASGRQHTLALKNDGTLWAWGRGNHGENGDITGIYRSSPTQVGTLATWSTVSAGKYSSFATRSDGSLWAWGYNAPYGYLGLNDAAHRSSPTQVGTLNTWTRVGSAYLHTSAIDTSGKLWVWGRNSQGGLGLADVIDRSSPTQVGTLTTWSRVVGGSQRTLALKTDGTLWTWGLNNLGQLSLSDAVARSSPVQIGTLADWKSIGGGLNHGLGLR